MVRVALGNCHTLQYNFQMNNDLNVASKSREGEEDSMWFHVHQTWEKSRLPTSWKKRPTDVSAQKMWYLDQKTAYTEVNWYVLPWWVSDKESACQCRRHGFDPWSRKIPHALEQLSLCTTAIDPAV